jgi:hypothetical protein
VRLARFERPKIEDLETVGRLEPEAAAPAAKSERLLGAPGGRRGLGCGGQQNPVLANRDIGSEEPPGLRLERRSRERLA